MDAKTRTLIAECFWCDATHYAKLGAIQDVAGVSLDELLDFDAVRDACLDLCGIPADNWTTVVGDPRPNEFCRDWYTRAIFALGCKCHAMALVDEFCQYGQEIQDAGGVEQWNKIQAPEKQ